jgi:general secretion pathway protein M
MNSLKDAFLQASPREQLAIVLGGGALVVVLLFVLVLMPMQKKRDQQLRFNANALVEKQQVRELAGQLLGRSQSADQSDSGGGLIDMLNRTLPKYQLQMEDFQPSGNTDARVRLAKAELNKILAWVNDVENVEGVQVKDFSAATGPEAGTALVNLRLHRE